MATPQWRAYFLEWCGRNVRLAIQQGYWDLLCTALRIVAQRRAVLLAALLDEAGTYKHHDTVNNSARGSVELRGPVIEVS